MLIALTNKKSEVILMCDLIKTTRRITFDITYQALEITNQLGDDNYLKFVAKNGVEIFSRSRMDIHTDRIWLLGSANDERSIRSGTMTFSSIETRDKSYTAFVDALYEFSNEGWTERVNNIKP